MIKPEFWEDEKIGQLSSHARLLFLACLNFADDEGFIRWNEAYLIASAFPYDKLSERKIKNFMKELENLKLVQVFETKNRFFVAKITNFKKHQKIDKPKPSSFAQDFNDYLKKQGLKNQSEIENNSPNGSGNGSPNDSESDSRPNEMNGKEKKEKEVNARARESEKEKEENLGGIPQTPALHSSPDQKDNGTSEHPMSWNDQSKYAQSLGISRSLTEQIITIAKDNKIMLYRHHWNYFAENQNLSVLLPILQSMADTSKKRSKTGFQHIGSG